MTGVPERCTFCGEPAKAWLATEGAWGSPLRLLGLCGGHGSEMKEMKDTIKDRKEAEAWLVMET